MKRKGLSLLEKVAVGFSVVLLGLAFSGSMALADEQAFTDDFRLQDCTFSTWGINPYFKLIPGFQLVLKGEEEDEGKIVKVKVIITVLRQIRTIVLSLGHKRQVVDTRVVEEREFKDGELVEISKNFFARCQQTNDIYYFGEDVDIFEDGEVSHEGAWLAGQNGAKPGLIMPGTFLLGSRYFQEVAPGVALDRAEHVKMGLEITTQAGTFRNCVKIRETSPLEPDAESIKKYCPGVGLVVDNEVQLVKFGWTNDHDEDD